ncbi:Uncharacterised protein [Bordetella pertussis]|nr:Uncharacterised protein [Bordetella pertussis]
MTPGSTRLPISLQSSTWRASSSRRVAVRAQAGSARTPSASMVTGASWATGPAGSACST